MTVLGTELKFNVHLEPIDGFHMAEYDFEYAFYVFRNRAVLIKKADMEKIDDDNYLVKITKEDALKIGKGMIYAEATAYIPDNDFVDGTRTEKLILCTEVTII